MQVGFKMGPRSWDEGKAIIENHGAKYAELWYRYDQETEYDRFFQLFHGNDVQFGLHYWGVVEDNIMPSFCYPDTEQYKAGIESVKMTIDTAARVGAHYVNVHPGSRVLTKLNAEFNELTLLSDQPVDEAIASQLLLAATKELHAYAKERDVLFLVETIPAHDAGHWEEETGRQTVLKTYHASPKMLTQLANQGIMITNDFGHTGASRIGSAAEVWQQLHDLTHQLAEQTRLLHINTLSEPFNGTDSHDGILETDWQSGVVPNRKQFLQLLKLFIDRDDVWAIPEPKGGQMTANYLALCRYVKDLEAAR